jgi:hypothetical protein
MPHPYHTRKCSHPANTKEYNLEAKDIKTKMKTPIAAITAQETQQPQPEVEADTPHNN